MIHRMAAPLPGPNDDEAGSFARYNACLARASFISAVYQRRSAINRGRRWFISESSSKSHCSQWMRESIVTPDAHALRCVGVGYSGRVVPSSFSVAPLPLGGVM
jgi:hypothetical protein